MTAVYAHLQGFLLTKETKLYIWGRLVVLRAMTVKNALFFIWDASFASIGQVKFLSVDLAAVLTADMLIFHNL